MSLTLYVDARSLQTSEDTLTKFNEHGIRMLGHARNLVPEITAIVALFDPVLPPLIERARNLFDRLQANFQPDSSTEGIILLQLSPLSHDAARLARFFALPGGISCTLVDQLPSLTAMHNLNIESCQLDFWQRLLYLKRYQLYAPTSYPCRDQLQSICGVTRDNTVTTGLASSQDLPEMKSFPDSTEETKVAVRLWSLVRSRLKFGTPPVMVRRLSSQPRIAFLSPYPPDQSGVADYTAKTLETLSRHAIVDVYTNCPAPRRDPWVRNFAPLSALPYQRREYDLILPVIGNSHFHVDILRLHEQFGGPCLIHDNRLAEVYAHWKGMEQFAEMATASIGRPVSVDECQTWIWEPWRLPSLFFDEVLKHTDQPIFHSRGIQKNVRRQYQRESSYLPFCCYRSFEQENLTPRQRRDSGARLGLRSDRVNLVTFGIMTDSKGPLECIWTVQMLRVWGIQADLYFVGPPGNMLSVVMPLIERLDLTDQIHFMKSWISDETYRDFILAADFGIQLRSNGFGGLSGALLDCIGAGLPTVANEDLAEAMNSPKYVLRVPDHFSPVLIAEAIANTLTQGRFRERESSDRREYIEKHSFERYAVEFLRITGLAG